MADNNELRLVALQRATESGATSVEQTIARAQAYFDFLTGASPTAVAQASIQTAAAATDAEPPRLDDPAVEHATEEALAAVGSSPEPTPQPDYTPPVTQSPTVTGDAASTTSSTADAGSVSPQGQPIADAPAAEQSPSGDGTIDLAKVQAAVIAMNKALGRDPTVALLQKFGGARLPDVPAEKHRALFEAVNAELSAAGKETVSE